MPGELLPHQRDERGRVAPAERAEVARSPQSPQCLQESEPPLPAQLPDDVQIVLRHPHLPADAERRLRAALDLAPNSPATNFAMSRYCGLTGRPDEAARYRKKFEELEAEQKKPRPAPR